MKIRESQDNPNFNILSGIYISVQGIFCGAMFLSNKHIWHDTSKLDRIRSIIIRRIVLGFEGEKNMPKLNFAGNLPNTIRNNILKLPVIPAGAFSNIQDGVQDGRQNVNTAI